MNKFYQKLIRSYRVNDMFMRYLLSVLLVVPFMMAMSSCSGDDKDNEPVIDPASELYGAWEASSATLREPIIIIFNSDGTLKGEIKSGGVGSGVGAIYDILIDYKYEVFSNTIKIFRLANTTKTPDSVLSYKVIGNKLILECISGEEPSFIECFTDKAVTFTRK